jgi:hypothetical protein
MIRIPFNRCVILTTLDFSQIADRLESAIYVGNPAHLPTASDPALSTAATSHPNQRYFGQVRDFKFLATRIVGHKYFHLPIFLLPTIEGKIHALHHGYEISLDIKIHDVTLVLLLTWFGGLFITISSILDNLVVGSKNPQYLTTVEIVAFIYIGVLAYFYLDAWRATKFFRNLFVRGFAHTNTRVVSQPGWSSELQLPDPGEIPSSTIFLKKNLPSFPSNPSKM